MNLHGIAGPIVAAVNPTVPADLRVAIDYQTGASGKQAPAYATPGALQGLLADDVLTVASVTSGRLLAGQTVAGAGVAVPTQIVGQLTGSPGGPGTYRITPGSQNLALEALTTSLTVPAQVQALTFRDLQQIEGLNLQGTRNAIYFYGRVEGIVRPDRRGGDLVTMPGGSVYLVAMVLENWPDWTKVAATLQNQS